MRQLKITKQITGRESYAIEKYLQEIGKIHVLNPDEEARLAKQIKKGNSEARERLVLSNLRFVVSVAKPIPESWIDVRRSHKRRKFRIDKGC